MEEKKEILAYKRVLAIDASLCNTGWSLFDWAGDGWELSSSGVIATASEHEKRKLTKGLDMSRRLKYIVKTLDALVMDGVDVMCCEMTSGGSKSKTAAAALASAKAFVISVAVIRDVPLVELSPNDVKKALTGNRTASKEEMNIAACEKYPVLLESYTSKKASSGFLGAFEHVADSVGVFEAFLLKGRKKPAKEKNETILHAPSRRRKG